jgi:Zn-finger nucleic acid-binding protein
VELKMTDRQGVEIDYCSQCRGVWLDRGELDKIIERSTASSTERFEDRRREARPEYRERDDDDRYGDDRYRRKRKKSFLDELFDF